MMKRYELRIDIVNKDYVDQLIISLVRQGYDVYLNEEENAILCSIDDEHLTELKYQPCLNQSK